jgi:hypothetical protein
MMNSAKSLWLIGLPSASRHACQLSVRRNSSFAVWSHQPPQSGLSLVVVVQERRMCGQSPRSFVYLCCIVRVPVHVDRERRGVESSPVTARCAAQ